MQQDEQIQQVEIQREKAEKAVKDMEALTRLQQNADFKHLIEEMYFKDEAIRLVQLLGHSEFLTEHRQLLIRNDMIGISALQQFLNCITQHGMQMKNTINECSEEIQLIHEENAGV